MSGSAGEFANTDGATEPLDTSMNRSDTYAARANQTASSMQETIARHFEPGDTRSTSHRFSDAPDSARSLFQNELDEDKEPGGGKSFMETVHEYVAKALGGGSRGAE
ncbi:transcriptional regulator family: GATA type zinc finger [Penicillium frequentans]|uniref:Transcriptional regulator family: GATA type zinc finger n=1 Tax=Penicillium frequentans TaxID=3151616 RepID=A0AAD6D9I6_9EURO|nr:transcriptional regulator family: GATA type zinc finger [Penicillium glabrum]